MGKCCYLATDESVFKDRKILKYLGFLMDGKEIHLFVVNWQHSDPS